MGQQRGKSRLVSEPAPPDARQLPAAQFVSANIGRESDDSHSLGSRSVETGHIIADQSRRRRLNQLCTPSPLRIALWTQAPRGRHIRSPYKNAGESLQVLGRFRRSSSLEILGSCNENPGGDG